MRSANMISNRLPVYLLLRDFVTFRIFDTPSAFTFQQERELIDLLTPVQSLIHIHDLIYRTPLITLVHFYLCIKKKFWFAL